MFHYAQALSLFGSLEWLDYKVDSTGTEDNSILLK